MRIVVLDGYTENPGDLGWEGLQELGELTVCDRTPVGDITEIIRKIGDAQAAFTNKTPLTKEVSEAYGHICYMGMLATRYNVVDCKTASAKGIPVCSILTYGTAAAAQYTIALLLEICHHIGHHSQAVHEGRQQSCPDWCFWDYPLIESAGKTIDIIGFGRIGQGTTRITQALSMKVLVYDVYRNEALENESCHYADLDELYRMSDVIVLHCPLFPETAEMINKESIAEMKDGVIVLSGSRGPLIVEEDLKEALNSGKVGAVGLDVVSTEPIKGDNPLPQARNCFITPHIAWAPRESRQRLMDIAAANLKSLTDGSPVNVVNKQGRSTRMPTAGMICAAYIISSSLVPIRITIYLGSY